MLLGLSITAIVWYVVIYNADRLPRTFIPGSGLTPFKIGAEYLLVAMSWLAAWQFAAQQPSVSLWGEREQGGIDRAQVQARLCFTGRLGVYAGQREMARPF